MKAVSAQPHTIEPLQTTIFGMLEWAAEQAPDQVAIKQPGDGFDEEIVWTYAELLGDARALASYLSRHFAYGDHVAIWGVTSGPWLLYEFAAAQLGIVLVTINPALRRSELSYMLARSQAKGIVMDRAYRGQDMTETVASLRDELPDLGTVLYLDEWRRNIAQADGPPPPSPTKPGDAALIVFTSGTTGKPKAAILTHFGAVNNPRSSSRLFGIPERSVWLASLPTFHAGGTVTNCMGAVSQLATQIIMPPFDPERVLRLIERETINYAPLVPAMVIAMTEHESFGRYDLSSFHHLMVGGTTITPAFVALVREKLACSVQVVFGQTEACANVAKTRRDDPDEAIERTVGLPVPGTTIRIADPETGETLDVGQVGEIRQLNPFATIGYFADPEATAKLFDDQGYLRTGDMGLIDEDGRLRMAGRLKEMIIRGGENIFPREIEDALADFDGVTESAVFGVPHDRWGEEVAVAVRVARPDITIDTLRDFLLDRIARYKVPRHWRIVEDFPRNNFGKTQKFELQRMFADAPPA